MYFLDGFLAVHCWVLWEGKFGGMGDALYPRSLVRIIVCWADSLIDGYFYVVFVLIMPDYTSRLNPGDRDLSNRLLNYSSSRRF